MADVKCEACGKLYNDTTNDNCPLCKGKLDICNDCGIEYSLESHKECPACKSIKNDGTLNSTKKIFKNVKVIDFDMEFGSMVMFMVKWAIASIPAMIILFLVGTFLVSVFGISIFALFN